MVGRKEKYGKLLERAQFKDREKLKRSTGRHA
jgi:hypothetical protein